MSWLLVPGLLRQLLRKPFPYSLPCMSGQSTARTKLTLILRPGSEAGILLSTYEFANANKLFCFNLVTLPSHTKEEASALSSFLSLTSYLFQHAHRSFRSSLYTYMSLFILQILVEDQILIKRMCSEESKTSVRLCRQRQPCLPVIRGSRPATSVILDIMIDGINHNLRRRLDAEFYM